jgi:TPR repeat protein
MYATGEGVPQDYKEAAKWFRKAAEQGQAAAQCVLGFMYNNGQGVIEDYIQAYVWYNISAANGDENGKTQKAMVAEEMTKEQIAKAQDLSREMIKANPKLMGD